MARRKHPFYKPVNHRVADRYRRKAASGIEQLINGAVLLGLFILFWGFTQGWN